MPAPVIPQKAIKVAGDIASAFLRAHSDQIAARVAGSLSWLRAPLGSLVLAIADAVDSLGEAG